MSAIKIQCGCGQKYAFDVEPIHGRMPHPVACPTCGADGTAAANQMLAENAQTPAPTASPAPVARIHVREPAAPAVHLAGSAPAPNPLAGRPATRLMPGQIDRPQAELEARAKIFWGDPVEDVVKFMMRNNFSYEEASELVAGYFDERAAAVRSNGIGKIVVGSGMVALPIVSWFVFAAMGVIPIKIFAITVVIGLWGAWRVFRGIVMTTSPRSEKGDVADQ